MTDELIVGTGSGGKSFCLPRSALTQTFAAMGIRGSGKTCSVMVMAEEMCKAHLPWIAFDPVGVWWGIRADHEGKPGGWFSRIENDNLVGGCGFPVVVIGGEHADIRLEKNSGARIAEALVSENVSAVIDLSQESKNTWRHFLTEFCLAMMQFNPELGRHIFIEEAPEFAPQRASHRVTAQCKEAVERLVRLGRNRGYGATLISQRPATVDKDILSQCENLIVLRTTGPHDRKALLEWIESKATERGLEKFVGELASLESGQAWFWSPHWLNVFERVRFRERLTFHPGATRTSGFVPKSAALVDVGDFVTRLCRQLSKVTVSVPAPRTPQIVQAPDFVEVGQGEVLSSELDDLRQQLAEERSKRVDAENRLAKVRDLMRPQYDALNQLFAAVGTKPTASTNQTAFEPWLEKAGKAGCRRVLQTLIERGQLTKPQLATLSGVSYKSSTFRNYLSWLRRNGLIETNGDNVILQQV